MRVLVVKDDNDTQLFDADTEEQLARASMQLLRERWDQGWYDEPTALEPPYTEEQIEALPSDSLKRQARRELDNYTKNEKALKKEHQFYNCTKALLEADEEEAVAATSQIFTGRIARKDPSKPFSLNNAASPYEEFPTAYACLKWRSDEGYEYEHIHLEETREA